MSKFKIPQTIDGLTREQLTALETQAVEAFDSLREDENLNADGMAQLRALATFITTSREAQTALAAQDAALAAELADMVQSVHRQDDQPGEGEDPNAPAQPDEPDDGAEGEDEDQPADPADPAGPPQQPDPARRTRTDGDPVTQAPLSVEQQTVSPRAAGRALEPVAAAAPANRPSITPARAAAGRTTPPADLGVNNRVVMTAAADLPNYANGHRFRNLGEVGEALRIRLSGFPDQEKIPLTSRTKMFLRQGVAQFTFPAYGLVADGRNDAEVIEQACDTNRLPGRSLIAAGAWCPPPVQLWDLCPSLISVEGTIDLPSFSFSRTGVTYPLVPNLIPDIDQIGFHYTEADSIAGTPKTCYTLPCTTWVTNKMECDGICIRGDIINDSSWPEFYNRLLGDVMKLHTLKMAKRKLDMVLGASIPVSVGTGSDIAEDNTMSGVISMITLAAADYRRRQLAASTLELEVLLPSWLPDVAAADAARAGACCGNAPTTRAEIVSRLGASNVRVQWITGWQDYFGSGTGLGDDTAALRWPGQLQFVIFAPGAFAYGTRNIIRMDAVYDSTLLEQNEYIRLFTEECSVFLARCYPSYVYTMGLCPSGAKAAPVDYSCTAVVAATGATAGTPGSFTPGGSAVPVNLAAMGSVSATPNTAWTTGQYVVTGDNNHTHWSGTGWIAGDAP